MEQKTQLSIIIPTMNEAQGIGECIDHAWKLEPLEIVVADGGSSDETVQIVRRQGCNVVCSEPGRGPQLNAGAAAAQGDVFLFLHADNWLEPGAGTQLRTAMSNSQVTVGIFRQRIDAHPWHYRLLERGNEYRARWLRLPYGDQGMFMRRETFERVGGFDKVPIMEDVIMARKISKLSHLVILPGPLHVNPRRWRRHGFLRQTLLNWSLLTAYFLGVSPHGLARFYRQHE